MRIYQVSENYANSRLNWAIGAGLKIFLKVLPFGTLVSLESRVQQSIGKGWGAQSITVEPASAISIYHKFFPTAQEPVIFDVGANVGKWTDGALKEFVGQIICFEPSRKSVDFLVRKYSDEKRVRIEAFALGGSKRTANLYSDSSGSSLSSLSKRDLRHLKIDFDEFESVNVVTLDEWITNEGVQPDILKLDVEGFELEVLSGGKESLVKTRVIQFEFGGCNIDTKTFFRDFWNLFSEIKFEVYRLTPKGVIRIPHYSESLETFATTNYYAINSRLFGGSNLEK